MVSTNQQKQNFRSCINFTDAFSQGVLPDNFFPTLVPILDSRDIVPKDLLLKFFSVLQRYHLNWQILSQQSAHFDSFCIGNVQNYLEDFSNEELIGVLWHLYHIGVPFWQQDMRKLVALPQLLMTKLNTKLQDLSALEIIQMVRLLASIKVKFKQLNMCLGARCFSSGLLNVIEENITSFGAHQLSVLTQSLAAIDCGWYHFTHILKEKKLDTKFLAHFKLLLPKISPSQLVLVLDNISNMGVGLNQLKGVEGLITKMHYTIYKFCVDAHKKSEHFTSGEFILVLKALRAMGFDKKTLNDTVLKQIERSSLSISSYNHSILVNFLDYLSVNFNNFSFKDRFDIYYVLIRMGFSYGGDDAQQDYASYFNVFAVQLNIELKNFDGATLYKALLIFLVMKQTLKEEDDLNKYLDRIFTKLLKKVVCDVKTLSRNNLINILSTLSVNNFTITEQEKYDVCILESLLCALDSKGLGSDLDNLANLLFSLVNLDPDFSLALSKPLIDKLLEGIRNELKNIGEKTIAAAWSKVALSLTELKHRRFELPCKHYKWWHEKLLGLEFEVDVSPSKLQDDVTKAIEAVYGIELESEKAFGVGGIVSVDCYYAPLGLVIEVHGPYHYDALHQLTPKSVRKLELLHEMFGREKVVIIDYKEWPAEAFQQAVLKQQLDGVFKPLLDQKEKEREMQRGHNLFASDTDTDTDVDEGGGKGFVAPPPRKPLPNKGLSKSAKKRAKEKERKRKKLGTKAKHCSDSGIKDEVVPHWSTCFCRGQKPARKEEKGILSSFFSCCGSRK